MVLVLERELVLVMLGRSACLRLELAFPVLTMEDRRLASVVEAPTRSGFSNWQWIRSKLRKIKLQIMMVNNYTLDQLFFICNIFRLLFISVEINKSTL